LRPAHGGGGHHPHHALRPHRLARRSPRACRHQGRVHAPGGRDRPDVHRPALRRADPAARARGPRPRGRGGGGQPRREPAAGRRARGAARALPRVAHRLRARVRPRPRRVRVRRLHRRQHADENGDHAAAHHHQARAVRLRGGHRDRDRDPPRVLRPPPRHQPPPVVERAPGRELAMAAAALPLRPRAAAARATSEPLLVKLLLAGAAVGFLALFLILPLVAVFAQALEKGWAAYAAALREPMAVSALKLTLLTAGVAVPLNLVFGVAAAWAIAKFDFPGKNVLVTLIDLPFAVSPVISGMVFILLFGRQGVLGPWPDAHALNTGFPRPGPVLR